ncbi:hypothetical protein GGR57DRAFT_446504 [Xylariaceae sp. FL1272]|nr:hypothetical protein GGR57DRAFT_446504 [Xylariaceae sp. FL1272]
MGKAEPGLEFLMLGDGEDTTTSSSISSSSFMSSSTSSIAQYSSSTDSGSAETYIPSRSNNISQTPVVIGVAVGLGISIFVALILGVLLFRTLKKLHSHQRPSELATQSPMNDGVSSRPLTLLIRRPLAENPRWLGTVSCANSLLLNLRSRRVLDM